MEVLDIAPRRTSGRPFGAPTAGAACLLALLAARPAPAQGEAGSEDLWSREHLLPRGATLDAWEGHGVRVDGFVNVFLGWNAKGGRDTSDMPRASHSVDLFVRADTERMGLWDGGSFLMQVKNNGGENVNSHVGSASQVVDDADFDETLYVDQLYYEHRFGSGTRVRVGYLDYQTILDRNAYANSEDVQFMNAALDNNLLVPLKIGFGAALFLEPFDALALVLGTADAENEILSAGFDTAFDGGELMAYGEATLRVSGARPGNYRLGVFYDPRRRPVFGSPGGTTGTTGVWAGFDQRLAGGEHEDGAGVGLFYRFGWREEESYAFSRLHSFGFEVQNPLLHRREDALGLAYYDLGASDDYRQQVDPGFVGESGAELYYRAQVSPWLAVSPGVQYVADPGGQASARDAVVFVLRTRVRL